MPEGCECLVFGTGEVPQTYYWSCSCEETNRDAAVETLEEAQQGAESHAPSQ